MDALASDVHARGGVLSVAHPTALGSPVCSGCAWDWPIESASVDLWEVFSAPRPMSEVALVLWRQLLQRGGRTAPAAAGDVHSRAAAASRRAATYVFVRSATREGVLDALRSRRVSAGGGPALEFWLSTSGGRVALIGDCVRDGDWRPHASVPARFTTVEISDAERCVYAEARDAQGRLAAVSAAIWISTSQ